MDWLAIASVVASTLAGALVMSYLKYLRDLVIYSNEAGEVVLEPPRITLITGFIFGGVALLFLIPLFTMEAWVWQLVFSVFSAGTALGAYRIFLEYFHHRVIFGDDYIVVHSSDGEAQHFGFEEIEAIDSSKLMGLYYLHTRRGTYRVSHTLIGLNMFLREIERQTGIDTSNYYDN